MQPDEIEREARRIIEETESVDTGQVKPSFGSTFNISDDGVYFLRDGDADPIRLAARVDVVAETRDERGDTWGRLLRWRDAEGRRHQWPMPMEILASDSSAVRAKLLNGGLPFITINQRLRERFTEYLQTAKVGRRMRSVARVGWHGNTFVFPDEAIGFDDIEETLYQPLHDGIHRWNTQGSVAEWQEHIGRRCSGNSRLVLSASCGFAGPILSLVGAESGGIHFYGATSSGKSTALLIGGSVCGGGGQTGFVQTWRTTVNGLEAIAELHNDCTLFLDELSQIDPIHAGEVAYLLGNGQGKARMTRNMGARRRPFWTLLYVSAGEMTLLEHLASGGKRIKGGAEVRLLNIDANAGRGLGLFENLYGAASPDVFARELKDASLRYYGAPFRAFIEQLTLDRLEVERFIRTTREVFITKVTHAGAGGELKRAAGRFALVGSAGELATKWGLTGWREGEAIEVAQRCFEEWVKGRGTTGASDMEAAIRQVRAFLEANGSSRFQLINSTSTEPGTERIFDRVGFKRTNNGQTEYLVLPEAFKNELCAGYNYREVSKELYRREFLTREHPNMTIKPRLPELGSVRVYCILADIMEDDES